MIFCKYDLKNVPKISTFLIKKRKNDERSDSIKIEEPEEKKQCLDSNQTDTKDNDNKLFHSVNVSSAVSKDMNQAVDVYDQIKIDNDKIRMNELEGLENCFSTLRQNYAKETQSQAAASLKVECFHCSRKINLSRMRQHIGKHILLKEIQLTQTTCGYCGRDGCLVSLNKALRYLGRVRLEPKSNDCPYDVKFNLYCASRSSRFSPCTNRPIECSLCKLVVWSYCMKAHYESDHSNHQPDEYISNKEEIAVKMLKY